MSDSVSFRLVRDGDVEWRVQSILGRHRMPSMRGATVLEVLESATRPCVFGGISSCGAIRTGGWIGDSRRPTSEDTALSRTPKPWPPGI